MARLYPCVVARIVREELGGECPSWAVPATIRDLARQGWGQVVLDMLEVVAGTSPELATLCQFLREHIEEHMAVERHVARLGL